MTSKRSQSSAHQFSFTGLDGESIALQDYAGKAVVIANTASQCGFTPQYRGLEEIWKEYKECGVAVLGVPSNDFGNQEPGDASQIREFCDLKYHVTFPMTEKTRVTGENAHPFYKWIAAEAGFVGRPHWNFYKYVLDREGRLVDWFSSITKPTSASIAASIKDALA